MTRRLYEKYCPDCLNYYKHSGHCSIIVWGIICGNQASRLEELKKIEKLDKTKKKKKFIESKDYIKQILKSYLKLWYKHLNGKGRQLILCKTINVVIHTLKKSILIALPKSYQSYRVAIKQSWSKPYRINIERFKGKD